MTVQAAASNNVRVTTPQPVKLDDSTYKSFYDYSDQYDPATHNKLLMSKARNSMTGFLDLMGMKESFSADAYFWTEEGELHNLFTGVTRTGNDFTITGHTYSKYDKVRIQDVAGDAAEEGLVSVLIDANTVTILPRAAAAFTVGTTALTVFKTGSEHPKGSDGPETSVDPKFTVYQNKPIIERSVYEVNGSDVTNISWFETEDGWFWTDYAAEQTRLRMDDELEISCLTSEKSDAASPIETTLDLNGCEGLFPALKDRGNVFDGIITDEADWDAITKRMDLVHGENSNYIFTDRDQDSAINKWLGSINQHDTAAFNYGIFENGEAMALNLGFRGFHKDGYDWAKQTWSALINPLKLGAVNTAASDKVRFASIPHGMTNIKRGDYASIDDSQGAKEVPYLTLMHKGRAGYSRWYNEFVTGSVMMNSPTDRKDVMTIDGITERSLRTAGAENMWIGIGT